MVSAPDSEPLSAEFLRETEIGRAIVAYLGCIDFCSDVLDAVVAFGPDAVPPLIQILQSGISPGVPELGTNVDEIRVIFALGKLRDIRALEPLVTRLEDADPLVRAGAAGALGEIGSDDTLGPLLPLLDDSDDLVRETTADALRKLGRPEALPALRAAAEAEPEAHVREAMEEAIQALEGR